MLLTLWLIAEVLTVSYEIFLLILLVLWLMLSLLMLIDELFIDMLVEIWLLLVLMPEILVLIDKTLVLT